MKQWLGRPTQPTQEGEEEMETGERRPSPSTAQTTDGQSAGEAGSPTEDYLKAVGERVAAMLDPLGMYCFNPAYMSKYFIIVVNTLKTPN